MSWFFYSIMAVLNVLDLTMVVLGVSSLLLNVLCCVSFY